MTDHFRLLDEPRRPWLDAEALKARFLQLSSELHPDRFHGQDAAHRDEAAERYSNLNSAYQTLREPRTRLLHLIELETGARPKDIQRIPPGTMDLFVAIGQSCQEVDGFLAERRTIVSPMLKVRLFQRGLEWLDRLKGLQAQVQERGRVLDAELRALNAVWDAAPAPDSGARAAALPLDRLVELYRGFSYVARWTEQIQERVVALASP